MMLFCLNPKKAEKEEAFDDHAQGEMKNEGLPEMCGPDDRVNFVDIRRHEVDFWLHFYRPLVVFYILSRIFFCVF